jgi:methylthioribose-1-phosphate isomerase
MSTIRPIEWIPESDRQLTPGHIRMLDQTRLPTETVYLELTSVERVWEAIKMLRVRGAPAIGIAAAMGLAAHMQARTEGDDRTFLDEVARAADYLATSRPTAVNLFWALDRMRTTAARVSALEPGERIERFAREAVRIRDEDAAMCRAIGRFGAELLQDGDTVLTHCNAGALATAEFGTALAPVYTAVAQGKRIRVFSDETRPLLQGARLTAWELSRSGVDVTIICDNMAAQVMKEGRVNCVMVGADRIAANGDAANKIGTYGVAVLARHHGIPFYVLAPTSTVDLQCPDGNAIPIEERGREEITCGFGRMTAPEDVPVYAPAFDVTPAGLITAIVCEKGVLRGDFGAQLRAAAG